MIPRNFSASGTTVGTRGIFVHRSFGRRSFGRRGVTLLEIAIVLAIIGIMAAIGASYLSPMLPSWRTRRAAYEFASHVEMARQLAGTDVNGYRIRIMAYDDDANSDTESKGAYTVAAAKPPGSAIEWDVLPQEEEGGDDSQGEGTFDFSEISPAGALPGVSLLPFEAHPAPEDDALVFDTRGFLTNSDGDFGDAGTIDFTFLNKRAWLKGVEDSWTVCVNRTGMVRVSSVRSPGCMGSASIVATSNGTTSTASGFTDDGSSSWGSSLTFPVSASSTDGSNGGAGSGSPDAP